MSSAKGKTTYQKQLRGGRDPKAGRQIGRRDGVDNLKQRALGDAIDAKFGFLKFEEGEPRLGWLLNYLATTVADESGMEKSGMDLYFIDRNGNNFKATILYAPYFYIDVYDAKYIPELTQHLQKRFENCRLEQVDMEDLDMRNHLSGKTHKFLKISFGTVSELVECKSIFRESIANHKQRNADGANMDTAGDESVPSVVTGGGDPLAFISDLREHDVPYTMRCGIDLGLRVGAWFIVTPEQGSQFCEVEWQQDFLELGEPRILAFDIECEKSPLKFPNAETDRVFMISYMVDQQGYLIVNREVVTEDISDFEYSPMAKFPGPFRIFNVENEEALLRKFVSHVQELRPHVIVTYNGDFFDWPYVDSRCGLYKISLYHELGIRGSQGSTEGEYIGRCMVHLDAFCWVNRDSYLPQGNRGLKAVTRCKLGYDPVEVDPEDMLRFARERPEHMASYSVSDAVATYYLYTTYVHNFIFSLSTIIPMGPEDVLRKGSGTLCEALLMVEAYRGHIICPNKEVDSLESFYNGHLLESETYIGGHVECLEAGVFRADIANKFTLIPSALQMLIDHVDRDLTFALEVENGIQRSDVSNYDEVKQEIVMALEMLRDCPVREEMPMIYHLDVGAMYPNIILTNRLQPSAIVSKNDCAACDFNRSENNCKRNMTWAWRGDYSPASLAEYNSVKRQLAYEKVGDKLFSKMSEKEQSVVVKARLNKYSQGVYKKTKITRTEERVHTVCMRENSFYVDTVRAFRDRRYDYKLLTKQWKGKRVAAEKAGDAVARKVAEAKEVLMDSLQVAHKCILNSFYGYVMRKGARWRSMEMAGIVTHTGAQLITQARILVEQVGRPLELDTDGIWCILPSSFPQDFKLKKKEGGSVHIDYPCAMLNADVHDRYTNHQYQDLLTQTPLQDGQKRQSPRYATHSECSIYFELDGPYKAMVLPASPEEGKLLKKKYAVFNFDNTIAELKGFELKRRGELELVKIFQSQVFDQFLEGTNLQESYDAVGKIANQWLDVLDTQGAGMDDDELMELISEKKTISKTLDEYEGRKATSLTTAERLSDFLGADMVKDKGLNCNLILSRLPAGAPVTERAIPVAIFSAEPAVRTHYLRKWLKSPSLNCEDFRYVVDWEYYKDRLGKTIQKIVTIPAGLQGVANPCPRVEHPVWVKRILQEKFSGVKQKSIAAMFGPRLSNPFSPAAAAASRPPREGLDAPITKLLLGSGSGTSQVDESSDGKKRVYEDSAEHDSENATLTSASVGDIEDISGLARSPGAGRAVAHFRKNRPGAESDSMEQVEDEMEEHDEDAAVRNSDVKPILTAKPSTAEEFDDWLEARKTAWRKKREERAVLRARLAAAGKGQAGRRQYGLTTDVVMSGLSGKSGEEDTDSSQRKRPMRIDDIVRNAALAVTRGFWQIVELQESDTPGVFVVWAFTGVTQLQRLYITVPRILFVNCHGHGKAEEAAKKWGGKLVKKELPHGRPVYNLYEIHLSEQKYIRNEKALGWFLSDPQVEGVYESKTPIWFRAVTRLSCVTNVANAGHLDDRDGLTAATAFQLKDLKFVNVGAHKYLEPDVAAYRQIFLYYTTDMRRHNVGIVGLFVVNESSAVSSVDLETGEGTPIFTAKAYVWISQPRGTMTERPPLQRIFRQFCPSEQSTCKFTTSIVLSMVDAWKACNEVLAGYVRERKGPTLVVAQGAYDVRAWRRVVPRLHEFPVVIMPSNSRDEDFPILAWQPRICRIMIQRFLILPHWFADRLSCARYAHVPVGNLGGDVNMTMTDVLFARQLEHNRHLLWAAAGPLPDIGGAENDQHGVWSDSLDEQTITEPGAYRCMCVELDIFGLAVASIMGSGMLDAQGLTTVSTVSTDTIDNNKSVGEQMMGAAAAISHDAACARAFNLLKASVTKWIHDTAVDLHADAILQGLYRFLCGHGQTLLHDPALYRVVYLLMTKLFTKLVAEFRRLGSKIVYADFYRVIIATNRHNYASAKEYTEFIIAAVADRELFQHLQINIKGMWEQLLWLDSANWGGIRYRDPDEEQDVSGTQDGAQDLADLTGEVGLRGDSRLATLREDDELRDSDEEDTEEDDESVERGTFGNDSRRKDGGGEYDFLDDINEEVARDTQDDETGRAKRGRAKDPDEDGGVGVDEEMMGPVSIVEGSWDLVTLLPPAAGLYLRSVIDQFMLVYREQWLLAMESFLETNGQSASAMTSGDFDECSASVQHYMQNLIRHRLGAHLLQTVDILLHMYTGPTSRSIGGVPESKTAGNMSANHLDTLNFVKFTTKILSLDTSLTNEVASLRRTLLTQLSMKEFNTLSEFEDPSASYVLRDIICSYCNGCRDVDLLRDPVLTGKNQLQYDDEENEDGSASVRRPQLGQGWICPSCRNGYDVLEVENRLLQDVERLVAAFLLQDFRCSKTSTVSTRICSATSELCAKLKMDCPQEKVVSQLKVLLQVAQMHKFSWLEETVNEMLKNSQK